MGGRLFILELAARCHRSNGGHRPVRASAGGFFGQRCIFFGLFCHFVIVHLSFGHVFLRTVG